MFWKKFVELCNKISKSPNSVAKELGYSSAIATKWKNGAEPRDATLQKIADYFDVSVDYLLGNEAKKKDTPNEDVLNEGEKMLLELFRSIPEADRHLVLSMIRAALNNQQ